MNKENKTVGFKTYRHKQNPKEEEFHDEFITDNSYKDMDLLVFGHLNSPSGDTPDGYLTARERKIVVSTIQWLGSPSGKYFLNKLGFYDEEYYSRRETLFSEKIACLEKQLKKIPKWIQSLFL